MYKFIFIQKKVGAKGLEFCFASSQLHGRHEVAPLSPFRSLNPLARSRCMQWCCRTACGL